MIFSELLVQKGFKLYVNVFYGQYYYSRFFKFSTSQTEKLYGMASTRIICIFTNRIMVVCCLKFKNKYALLLSWCHVLHRIRFSDWNNSSFYNKYNILTLFTVDPVPAGMNNFNQPQIVTLMVLWDGSCHW